MMIDTPASQAFEAAFDEKSPPVEAAALDKIFDGDGAEGASVATGEPQSPELTTGVDAQSPELTGQEQELTGQADESGKLDAEGSPVESPATEQPTAEENQRQLWDDKKDVANQIADCSQVIEEAEAEIDEYQAKIKDAKEILKGAQAQLARFAAQMRTIMEGNPLPRRPVDAPVASNSTASATTSGQPANSPGVSVAEAIAANNWRIANTSEVISGLPKMGPKKLERILEIAPTMGQLIDLQIAASRACIPFKDNLPSGWGVELVDALETCICEYIGQFSDDEPVAVGPVASDAEPASGEVASDDEPAPASDAGE